MAKRKRNGKKQPLTPTILLAYFHRYGWLALLLLILLITNKTYDRYVLSIGMIAYSIWTFLGYIFRWKHVYCSYQNASHQPMTPDKVRWNTVKKADAYGVPTIFLVLGVALLLFLD